MKLVLLLYIEEHDPVVVQLLRETGIEAWSRLPIEGHGDGTAGWYGSIAPYASRMVFTILPDDHAAALTAAVRGCHADAEPRHPIHAVQLPVEAMVASGGGSISPGP